MRKAISAEAIPVFERTVAIGEFVHQIPEWDGPLYVVITYEDGVESPSIMGMQQFEVLRAHIKEAKGDKHGKDTSEPPGDDGGSLGT